MKKVLILSVVPILVVLNVFSGSQNSLVKINQETKHERTLNNLKKETSEFDTYHYLIRVETTTESKKYKPLIDNQFRKLKKIPFVKISFNKELGLKYDCEIDILFDGLTVKDEEYTYNKHFSKAVNGFQAQSDDGPTTYTETVRGYVYQVKKMRKLNWNIIMKINSDSNNCKSTNSRHTEEFISRSFNNTISGDERAISEKYKKVEEPLLSEENMIEEVIKRVYKKTKYHLKKNH